jgi:hypothetical protein
VPMDKTMISYGIIEHGRLVDVKPIDRNCALRNLCLRKRVLYDTGKNLEAFSATKGRGPHPDQNGETYANTQTPRVEGHVPKTPS